MNKIITIYELYVLARDQPVTDPILSEVISHAQENPGIKVKELAEILHFQKDALSATVRVLTGMPLVIFLRQWRLLTAMELLKDRSLSYRDVALRCAFTTVQSLSRFLCRRIRCTAFEYREGHSNRHRRT